jgi:DNA-binding SARP family transcriptional activator
MPTGTAVPGRGRERSEVMALLVRGTSPDSDLAGTCRLRLLGGFSCIVQVTEYELPVAAQRVVAVAALRGRMSRSRTAGLLWPETTEHRALASLRTAIWRVNRVVPMLVAGASMLELNRRVEVDVHELVATARALQDVDERAGIRPEWVYSDVDLLPDWDDEWIDIERDRLRQLRLHMIEALAERLIGEGRFGLAIEAAMAAVRADNLRESAHRMVIRAHVAEGNVIEARRAYEACRTVLVREIGVEPSQQTRRYLEPTAGRS